MSTLSYSATLQDQIALRLANVLYASLESRDQKAIDNDWTTGNLAAGHAYDAETLLRRYNNFLNVSGSDEIPAAWAGWFVWETVYRAALHLHPDRVKDIAGLRKDALVQALETHTQTDHDGTASTVGWVVNHANIRKYVLDVCVHQERMVLPTPERVDAAMRSRFVRMWNMAYWPFRRETSTITLPTSGQPTYSNSNTVDAVTSTKLYYTDDAGKGAAMQSVTADEMAALLSQGFDDGRPRFFRVTKTAGTLVWQFERTPDQEYTVKAEIVSATPALATAANFDTAVGKLPPEFLDLLRESVAADVLASYGSPAGRAMVEKVDAMWAQHLAAFDDPGMHDERESIGQGLATVADLVSGQGPAWVGVMGGQV